MMVVWTTDRQALSIFGLALTPQAGLMAMLDQ
jgi:hypothetical protein